MDGQGSTGGIMVQPLQDPGWREIWRERPADCYADSIQVHAEHRAIRINCGGRVVTRPLREVHTLLWADASNRAPGESLKELARRYITDALAGRMTSVDPALLQLARDILDHPGNA